MMTNKQREAFEKFYATIQPSVPQAGYEDITMDAAYLAWVAAKADSEQKYNELNNRCTGYYYDIEKQALQIAELQAHINKLREALAEIGSANWHFSMSRKIANEALASTPAQSLKAHDDVLIERCAKECEYAATPYRDADKFYICAEAVRALKGE